MKLNVTATSSYECNTLDASFGLSDVSGVSLGETPSSPESMVVDTHVSSPISSPVSPPYSPISSQCSSSDQEFGEMVHDQPSPAISYNPSSPTQQWHGYKIVGDNLDKNVKPRNQTLERQTHSLHYFNCYAVHDRLNLSTYSDDPPDIDLTTLDTNTMLPSQEDLDGLIHNMAIIAGRIVHKYIPAFAEIPHLSQQHIKHPYSKQMSSKSTVVSVMLLCVH